MNVLHKQDQSHFIVIDAIDGAGKSTAIQALSQHLTNQGRQVFDLVAYQKQHHTLPEINELSNFDVLISAEPTYSFVGKAIREELLKSDKQHSGKIIAEAFSLDRYILFSRIILPFLNSAPNKLVIQDRGVITSLAYQSLQDESVTLDWLTSLTGNALELSRPPNIFFLLDIPPEIAASRLNSRQDKQDQTALESQAFQLKVSAQYRNPAVLAPYQSTGTQIIMINANQSPTQVADNLITHLAKIL